MYIFYKHVGIKDSNEVEVLAIMEALHIYSNFFQDSLIVESDLANAFLCEIFQKSMEDAVPARQDSS